MKHLHKQQDLETIKNRLQSERKAVGDCFYYALCLAAINKSIWKPYKEFYYKLKSEISEQDYLQMALNAFQYITTLSSTTLLGSLEEPYTLSLTMIPQ